VLEKGRKPIHTLPVGWAKGRDEKKGQVRRKWQKIGQSPPFPVTKARYFWALPGKERTKRGGVPPLNRMAGRTAYVATSCNPEKGIVPDGMGSMIGRPQKKARS